MMHLLRCMRSFSLVSAISKQSSRNTDVMHLLRCMQSFFDIEIWPEHIAGSINCTADHLSWNNMQSFFSLNSQVSQLPVPFPPPLTLMVKSRYLDWTSLHFNKLFKDTTTWTQNPPHGNLTPQASNATWPSATKPAEPQFQPPHLHSSYLCPTLHPSICPILP